MKTIPLAKVFELLKCAYAVIWSDQKLLSVPNINLDNEDPEGEFLYVEGTNSDYYEFEASFRCADNQEVVVEDNHIILKEKNGEEIEVQLLGPMKLD